MNIWPMKDLPKQYNDAISKNKLDVKFNNDKKNIKPLKFSADLNLNIDIFSDMEKFMDRRNTQYLLTETGSKSTYVKYELKINETYLPKSKLDNITYTGYLKKNRDILKFGSELEFNIDKFYSGSIDSTK